MTLVVSLRNPEGIVLAGDGLSSVYDVIEGIGRFVLHCPTCHAKHTTEKVSITDTLIPSTTCASNQKVFPLFNGFGIGAYGHAHVMEKSVGFALKEMERQFAQNGQTIENLNKVVVLVSHHFRNLLAESLTLHSDSLEAHPAATSPFGFQLVGYAKGIPITVQLDIGKKNIQKTYKNTGITFSGDASVAQTLHRLYKQQKRTSPVHARMSLKDAIDYVIFLIETTAQHQRFSGQMPSVGGDIDVAVITPLDGFQWMQKKLILKTVGDAS